MQIHTGQDSGGNALQTVVMLYEEAIRSIGRAATAIEDGDVMARCRNVERAIVIVTDLYGSLDMERGGEIAERLATAYRLVLARLVLVNGRNDAELARGAAGLLKPMLDAWRRLAFDITKSQSDEVAEPATVPMDPASTARAVASTL